MKKKFNIGSVKLEMHDNGFPKGLVLKRDLNVREAKHLMRKFLGIDVNGIDEFEYKDEYDDYNNGLTSDVNSWLKGEIEDRSLMEYAYDCMDDELGVFNIIPIILWLQSKDII